MSFKGECMKTAECGSRLIEPGTHSALSPGLSAPPPARIALMCSPSPAHDSRGLEGQSDLGGRLVCLSCPRGAWWTTCGRGVGRCWAETVSSSSHCE